jgi:decaprenylphospho-beta-D-ribofuranose 2-oxidase
MQSCPQFLSGWGNFPCERCQVYSPTNAIELRQSLAKNGASTFIPRGLGRAYGDSALNRDAGVVLQTAFARLLSFDAITGVLECEAGVSFAHLIEVFLPRGWFLPTTPGTKFVTVGGAIAADVHGKNHHQVGSLGNFIQEFDLLLADGSVALCSRTQRPELFWATIGGMGLTGCIIRARMQLVKVPSVFVSVDYRKTKDLDETLDVFSAEDKKFQYSVAWIDCLASGKSLGRSVVMLADDARPEQLVGATQDTPHQLPGKRTKSVPFNFPRAAMMSWNMRLFNTLYYSVHQDCRKIIDFNSFFYPLDGIHHWNRIYGRRGFAQYQAWFPPETSRRGLIALLERISASGMASFLAVLKSCGDADGGILSYLRPGHTLALDFANTGASLIELSAELDRILLEHGGRLYLAKDALTCADSFHAMYPRLPEFLAVKAEVDPRGRFSSSQARRLEIV